jgi:hypothetical protein
LPDHTIGPSSRSAPEQVELLAEQLFVLAEVEAEQRERLGERAAAEDDLRASVRDGIECREAFVHPDRVVGAQHRHGGAEVDVGRT